jgi:polyhydroxyalkanoate synthesis regulator phasin
MRDNEEKVFDQFIFKPALEMFKVFKEQAEAAPESYANLMNLGTKFWASVMKGMAEQAEGPSGDEAVGGRHSAGVEELFRMWGDLYEETMGKYLQIPAVGPAREYSERMQKTLHSFMQYQAANVELQRALCVPLAEAMKQIAEDLHNSKPDDLDKKDLKHFQQEWMKAAEDRFLSTLRSPEFSKVLANSMNKTMDFWDNSQKTLEDYLKFFPVATSSELEEVHRELYELKKQVRLLASELKERKEPRESGRTRGKAAAGRKSASGRQ